MRGRLRLRHKKRNDNERRDLHHFVLILIDDPYNTCDKIPA